MTYWCDETRRISQEYASEMERNGETYDISKIGVNDGLNDTSDDSNRVKSAFGKVPSFWFSLITCAVSRINRLTCTSNWECTILCTNPGLRDNVW